MAVESNSNPNSDEQARNWLELPADITSMILMKLGAVDILFNAQNVCSLWRKICNDPLIWSVVDMKILDVSLGMDCDLEKMCMHAVDRSCGQLVDISIQNFGTDELLHYITQSSNQLRKLRLVNCGDISDKGLTEAVSKLPLLEDLEIVVGLVLFDSETLVSAGRCCPLLKSLKLTSWLFRGQRIKRDEEALAIAENMRNLHHLHMFGNSLTNRGLQAILDGCPHLESLDLRQCPNLNLVGQLGTECAERIKCLHLPYDPADGYASTTGIVDFGHDYSHDEDYYFGVFDTNDDYYEFSGGSDFFDFGDFYSD